MKTNRILLVALWIFLSAGIEARADQIQEGAAAEELFGARFKEGKGVELSDITRASLKLETAEVTEKAISDALSFPVQVISVSPKLQAVATLPKQLADKLKLADRVELSAGSGQSFAAQVADVTSASISGDIEILVEESERHPPAKLGDTLSATLPSATQESVTAIPRSALLRNVNGSFVYVVNGSHFLRTQVKTGREGDDFYEITDGLYPGDEVVTSAVNSLWYAELQAIRGGQSCADEH